jgi:hypothetical protein
MMSDRRMNCCDLPRSFAGKTIAEMGERCKASDALSMMVVFSFASFDHGERVWGAFRFSEKKAPHPDPLPGIPARGDQSYDLPEAMWQNPVLKTFDLRGWKRRLSSARI